MAIEHFRLDGLSLGGHGDAYTNLVSTPSFESVSVGVGSWSGASNGPIGSGTATLARSTAQSYSGVASMSVATPSAANTTGASIALGSLASGQTVGARVMVRVPTTQNMRVALEDNIAGNGLTIATVSVPANTWTALPVAWIPTALSANARLYVYQVATTTAQTWFIDAAIVVYGATVPTYFDGDTPGYYWTGTAYASASASSPFEIIDAPVFTPAPLRLDWVGGPDSDGTVPLDAGHSDNSTLTIPLRIVKQATADAAWTAVGLLLDTLEATRASRDGLELVWAPKDASDSWLLTVRSGEIAEIPMASRGDTSGYLLRMPRFTVALACSPFLYRDGETVDFTEVTSTEPVFSITLDDVPGHVDAEATVTITDNATQARRHVEWGLGEGASGALLTDSASLVTSGFAGAATTRTGGYSANGVIRATLADLTQAVCGTGNLAHVGTHRVKARIWVTSTAVRVRLAYRTANGPYSYTPWVTPQLAANFCEVSFGIIAISEVQAGTQQWDGRIEAYSATIGDTIDVDYLLTLPCERYGRARGLYVYQAGLLVARDAFTSITSGTALNARVAPTGGTWATAGATTDFTAADAPTATDETITRATVSDSGTGRHAVLGSTSYTAVEVSADIYATHTNTSNMLLRRSVVARYVDSSNYLRAMFDGLSRFTLDKVIAGTPTTLADVTGPTSGTLNAWYTIRLVVLASGIAIATWFDAVTGAVIATLSASDSTLATGGTLATGKPALIDYNGTADASGRWYDNFYAATPPFDPVAINSGRALFVRHDSCELQSSDAATYGPPTWYRGADAFVPAAGVADRSTRLWCKARRTDIEVTADANIADSTKLDVQLRPRYRLPVGP